MPVSLASWPREGIAAPAARPPGRRRRSADAARAPRSPLSAASEYWRGSRAERAVGLGRARGMDLPPVSLDFQGSGYQRHRCLMVTRR